MSNPLDEVLFAQKKGDAIGIPSICSAHPWVLRTALQGEGPTLIEATCNQVNQFGGYTGMKPSAFAALVRSLAEEGSQPAERLLLGGDHLGPSPWQGDPMDVAMPRAAGMVQAYVQAGFTKLHLDASMKLGDDDPVRPLEPEQAAQRTAFLARAAEACADPGNKPRYVIGSEVPLPGGATVHEQEVHVTTVEAARHSLEITQAAFKKAGLGSALERVIALVVQPGVEFGDDFVVDYDPEAGRYLARYSETIPFIYEAHSTDYQRRECLRALVRAHFAILKVGPALTNAFREAVFSLAMIENEMVEEDHRSRLIETLEAGMLREPGNWQKHYHGTEPEKRVKRKFSLSDRIRYYWPDPAVEAALARLLENLNMVHLPLSLISQYLPQAYEAIRRGQLHNSARDMISHKIKTVLNDYWFACGNKSS